MPGVKLLRSYGFSLLLLVSIAAGLGIGRLTPQTAQVLRPLGDLFLNLIFMLIVPLVFCSIAGSIAAAGNGQRLSRITTAMLVIFLGTSVVSATLALLWMWWLHPAPGEGIALAKGVAPLASSPSLLSQLVATCTTSDFPELLSRKSMLPLMLFAVAVGVATRSLKEQGEPLARLLQSGAAVFVRLIDYVMYLAPLGLCAWFAATVVDTGAQLASTYLRAFVVYYSFAMLYFGLGFSAYAYLAGSFPALKRFWSHMLSPSLTALGTCSSMATMPINLEASAKMGVPEDVRDVVIPIGAVLHKDGSVIGGVLKVLFALSLFQQSLTPGRAVMVIGVAILVGVVMGAIPSGGMMGELLILSAFGFPPETLPLLAVISILIDPVATLLNATGDNVAAMMVTRWLSMEGCCRKSSDSEIETAAAAG